MLVQAMIGIGAVGGIIGGGFALKNATQKQENDVFLIVSHGTISNSALSTEPPTKNLWEKVTSKPDKRNYYCELNIGEGFEHDKDCVIYSIPFHTENKSIESKELKTQINKEENKITAKADLTSKKFFLLKIKLDLFNKWRLSDHKKIKLFSLEEDLTASKRTLRCYSELNVHAKVQGDQIESDKSFMIAKATNNTVTSSITQPSSASNKCQLEGAADNTAKTCIIHEIGQLTTVKNKPAELKNLNFSSVTFPSTQSTLTITQDKYYLIKTTEKDWNTDDLKTKKIIFIEETATASNNKKTTKLTFESFLIANLTENSTPKEAIIVK